MTMLVSRYKIEIKEEPHFASETFEERYARVTAFDQGLTTRCVVSTSISVSDLLIILQAYPRAVGF